MDNSFTPFDWQRIFVGDLPWLFLAEVVFRTAVMYTYALLAARVIGKRGMSNLTPFEWIIVIMIGTSAGDPTLYPGVPLVHGMLVITVVVFLDRLLANLMRRIPGLESFVNSDPALVVHDGRVLGDMLDKEHITDEEFLMMLRMEGLRDTGSIERAYLEPSGQVSVLRYPEDKQVQGSSTLPVETKGGRGEVDKNALRPDPQRKQQ